MKKGIFIIGMPGAGKTFWGRRIATAWHLPFADTDTWIENSERRTIPQIFEQLGEAYFREKETEVLKKIIGNYSEAFICSTGGGLPANTVNLSLMQQHGFIVYLHATPETLLYHLSNSRKVRPLMKDFSDLRQQVLTLYQQRKAVYEQAHYTFAAETFSLEIMEPVIRLCIEQR